MYLKERIQAGHKAVGCMMRVVRNSTAALLASQAGIDFVMLDCEHGSYDFETLHDLFVALQLNGVDGFVRVPELSKGHVSRVLDCGATGVMVPMINTVEQAKVAVEYSKYRPVGNRGFIGANGYNLYNATGKNQGQTMEEQNRRIITIVQIESKEAVENARQIAAVDGVDVLMIGQADMSATYDMPGDYNNPVMQDAVRRVGNACKEYGKVMGLAPIFPQYESFLDSVGVSVHGTDLDFIKQGMVELAKFRDTIQNK